MTRPNADRRPDPGRRPQASSSTLDQKDRPEVTPPRLAQDADTLLFEGAQFLEAGEQALAEALLRNRYDELVMAAAHSIVCSAKARRFFSAAVHLDLVEVS